MPDNLLTLPFAIQVAIANGYLGYLVAFAGLRSHHTTTDTILRVFVISSITLVIFQLMLNHPVRAAVVSLLVSMAAGVVWRKLGYPITRWLMRQLGIAWTDDIPSAWLSITSERTDIRPSQIAVQLKDGRLLLCEDTRRFASAPFGPCMFGQDGSVAMYVTAEMRPDGEWVEKEDVSHPQEGVLVTHIPASEIVRTEIRHWRKPNASAEMVEQEETTEASAEEPRV